MSATDARSTELALPGVGPTNDAVVVVLHDVAGVAGDRGALLVQVLNSSLLADARVHVFDVIGSIRTVFPLARAIDPAAVRMESSKTDSLGGEFSEIDNQLEFLQIQLDADLCAPTGYLIIHLCGTHGAPTPKFTGLRGYGLPVTFLRISNMCSSSLSAARITCNSRESLFVSIEMHRPRLHEVAQVIDHALRTGEVHAVPAYAQPATPQEILGSLEPVHTTKPVASAAVKALGSDAANTGHRRRPIGPRGKAVPIALGMCATIIAGALAFAFFAASASAPNVVTNTIRVGKFPRDIAITPDGRLAYTTNAEDGTVSVIAISSNQVTDTIPVGGWPTDVAVTPNGRRAYVTNMDDGTVSVIATNSNQVVDTIEVGDSPAGIAINPDGKRAYVTNADDGTVSVIATDSNQVTHTIKVGDAPAGVAVTPEGNRVYTTNLNDGKVRVIDTRRNRVVETLRVAKNPSWAIAFTPDGTKAYTANSGYTTTPDPGTVSVIDTSTNEVTETMNIGDSPTSVAVTPDGHHAYVASAGDDTVIVIDTSSHRVADTIKVSGSPSGVVLAPDGQHAYTANSDGTVSVIG